MLGFPGVYRHPNGTTDLALYSGVSGARKLINTKMTCEDKWDNSSAAQQENVFVSGTNPSAIINSRSVLLSRSHYKVKRKGLFDKYGQTSLVQDHQLSDQRSQYGEVVPKPLTWRPSI
jgi:hypothetical protein